MEHLDNLSTRASTTLAALQGFGFQATPSVKPIQPTESTPIDASLAENWSIRPELISLFRDAIQSDLGAQHLSYSDSHLGDTETTQALSTFFNSYFSPHLPVKDVHIAIAPGSSRCLDGLMQQICDPGDGVLVPAPFWNGFDFHFKIHASVHPVVAPLHSLRDAFNPELLIASLTETFNTSSHRIRAVVLTNPGNPIGQCYTADTLRHCARFCHDRDLHLICDEVYALSYFGGNESCSTPFTSILNLDIEEMGCDLSRVHVVWSISKDFGCSGLRLGCVVSQANPELILGLRLPTSTEVSSLTALCTTALLTSPKLSHLVRLNKKRLLSSYRAVASVLEACGVGYIPATAGVFIFAQLAPGAETIDDEVRFQKRLRDSGLLVSPGRGYHVGTEKKGWFRLTFALEEGRLRRALAILEECLRDGDSSR